MKKKLACMLLATLFCSTAPAQISIGDVRILQEKDTIWGFGYKGINLYLRKMHRIDIAYPSKDPEGNDCELSGRIIIPSDVYEGEQPCDGIVLYNHYTQLTRKGAPTRGYATGEDLVLANPLRPNYIMVTADFYGFGITEDKPQWFCFGDVNGQASIDCLLAAKALFEDRQIPQGKFLINAGYSSGGYDAIATQKVRDMKYKDVVSFDRTVVGGLPFDMEEAYNCYISDNDSTKRYFALLMVLDSYNTHGNMGFTAEQMLQPEYAAKMDEWFHSGKYETTDLINEMRGVKLSEILQEPFLDRKSDEYKKLIQTLREHNLKNNWVPDPTQKYSVYHLYKDFTVPVSSDRALINFLSSYKYGIGQANPFGKTIIPEKTHLRTNFLFNSEEHTLVGGLGYYIGLTATLAALPILYYDDELNTHYADLIKDATPLEIVKKLDEKFNIRQLLRERSASDEGGGSFFDMLTTITNTVNDLGEPFDLTMEDILQIADDSGLTLVDILQIYLYLTSEDTATAREDAPINPFMTDYFTDYLYQWIQEAKGDFPSSLLVPPSSFLSSPSSLLLTP